MGMVWHGQYIKYFEDGREDFGSKFGISYLDLYKQGFLIPLVQIKCDDKKTLVYGEWLWWRPGLLNLNLQISCLIILYKQGKIMNVIARGSSAQVFLKWTVNCYLVFLPSSLNGRKRWDYREANKYLDK